MAKQIERAICEAAVLTEVVTKPEVSLSYSYADRAWPQEFAGRLEESGIEVWTGGVMAGFGLLDPCMIHRPDTTDNSGYKPHSMIEPS